MNHRETAKSSLYVISILWITFMVTSPVKDPVTDAIHRKIEILDTTFRLDTIRVYNSNFLVSYYRKNDYTPLWSRPVQTDRLIDILKDASVEGLNPSDYHVNDITQLMNRKSPGAIAARDILLTDAFILYTDHIKTGKVDSTSLSSRWSINPANFNPQQLLQQIQSSDLNDLINRLRHHTSEYIRMREALARYRKIRDAGGWTTVPAGKSIRPGLYDTRIPFVRKRLFMSGDIDSAVTTDPDFYDYSLQAGVVRFQQRNGLKPDGIIGENTISAMNIPVTSRIEQLRVNMERRRWLPDDMGSYYLQINIANFDLQVVKQNRVIDRHKVIIGKFFRKTPVFRSRIEYLLFNPDWTVPPTILKKDLIPSIRKNPAILTRNQIRVFGPGGAPLQVDTINWNKPGVLGYTYREKPGGANPLGAVKFVFPNRYNVYLHDTPSKYLFENHVRMYSSGCIRVNNALELAQLLLDDPVKWPSNYILDVVKSGKTIKVPLQIEPRIYVVYFTAWVDSSGIVEFRNDIYKRDPAVLNALNQKPDAVTVR